MRIERNASPLRPGDTKKLYHSEVPIKYALEINSGESTDISSGDLCKLYFNNELSRYVLNFN